MNNGLNHAIVQLTPKIAKLDFEKLINDTPYLSSLQRDFYLQYLTRRRELLFS